MTPPNPPSCAESIVWLARRLVDRRAARRAEADAAEQARDVEPARVG